MQEPNTLLAHPGTQYSLRLARELAIRGCLSGFYTGLAVRAESNLARLLKPCASLLKMERQWQNRLLNDVPGGKLHCYPSLEIGAWWRARRRGGRAGEALKERNENFQRGIPERAITDADAVIGFDTSSQILAGRTKAQGKPFILDRSIAHPRAFARVAVQLTERFPEWEDARQRKTEHELALEDGEHLLADLIVTPSRFAADSLIEHGVPPEKIRVNPFGTETNSFRPPLFEPAPSPLVFTFVGALSARKGLPLLLQAWKWLNPAGAELWVAGTGNVPAQAGRGLPDSVRWLGPVTRRKLPALFQQSHVFVFPSFFEGLAQVQLEAAACGLPIIATRASGGEEVVEEGLTGFIVEAGNLEQLSGRMERLIEAPSLVKEMRAAARRKAADWSWSGYGDRWQTILRGAVRCSQS